jgi:hypothetical protein
MHLMRVLEVGLAALAEAVGIKKQNDWGRYLKEINAELERNFFRRSRLGIPDSEVFLIQDAGWRKEASMDGVTFINGFAQACDRGG